MKKQAIIDRFMQQLSIEKITKNEIRNYLSVCAEQYHYSFSSMKYVVTASIKFLYCHNTQSKY